MIIGRSCFRKLKNDFVIENYPNLEKIVVKNNSLQNLNSLKICNNEKLKTIEIEDGEYDDCALCNAKNVIIESISTILFDIFKSSQSTIIQNRKLFILENNKFIFIKYDYQI